MQDRQNRGRSSRSTDSDSPSSINRGETLLNPPKVHGRLSLELPNTLKPIKVVVCVALTTVAVFIPMQRLIAQADSDTVAAITKLENDGIKADLAADTSWFDKFLADDWMSCQSDGIWITKADALKMMADAHKLKYNNEKLSDLKVRVYGNTAVATYKDIYDGIVNGKHRVQSAEVTDVWVKIGSDWKVVSSQGTKAK